jgi:hypothetical protein
VGAEVGVWDGVGVYFSTLIPGPGRITISSVGLAQPAKPIPMAAKSKRKILPNWISAVLFNPVILMYLFRL